MASSSDRGRAARRGGREHFPSRRPNPRASSADRQVGPHHNWSPEGCRGRHPLVVHRPAPPGPPSWPTTWWGTAPSTPSNGSIDGRLGDGTLTSNSVPVPVAGGLHFTEIVIAVNRSCALDVDGGLHCWGTRTVRAGAGGTTPMVPGNSTTPRWPLRVDPIRPSSRSDSTRRAFPSHSVTARRTRVSPTRPRARSTASWAAVSLRPRRAFPIALMSIISLPARRGPSRRPPASAWKWAPTRRAIVS